MRESPALNIIELLVKRGAHVKYHDTHIPEIPQSREHANLMGWRSAPLSAQSLSSFDAVVLITDHDNFDYPFILEYARMIVDTRNAFARRGLSSGKIVKA